MDFSRVFELKSKQNENKPIARLANWIATILLTNQRAVKSRSIIQHLFPSPAKTISNSIGTMRLPQRIQTTTLMITTMKILILKKSHYT